jgi:hypothetical protein
LYPVCKFSALHGAGNLLETVPKFRFHPMKQGNGSILVMHSPVC